MTWSMILCLSAPREFTHGFLVGSKTEGRPRKHLAEWMHRAGCQRMVTSPFVYFFVMSFIGLFQVEVSFNPIIPVTINPMQKSRAREAGSENRIMPKTAVPAAPMPVQIA